MKGKQKFSGLETRQGEKEKLKILKVSPVKLHVFLRAGRDQTTLVTDHRGRGSAEETHGEVGVGLHLLLLLTYTIIIAGSTTLSRSISLGSSIRLGSSILWSLITIVISVGLDVAIEISVGVVITHHLDCSLSCSAGLES